MWSTYYHLGHLQWNVVIRLLYLGHNVMFFFIGHCDLVSIWVCLGYWFLFHLPDNNSFGYDMGWWKEEHFNASDADGDGLLNITEFNEWASTFLAKFLLSEKNIFIFFQLQLMLFLNFSLVPLLVFCTQLIPKIQSYFSGCPRRN